MVRISTWRECVGSSWFHSQCCGSYVRPQVLEQTKADVCLVSSRADEHLIVFCQEFSEPCALSYPELADIWRLFHLVELAGGQCQVRPHREFIPQKGHNKLQQLRILSQLPQGEAEPPNSSTIPAPRNVDDFIDSRRNLENDPTAQKLYAAIRLLNFGGDEAPLCVR